MRTIKCQICGKEVEATSSRQKYCPECAKEKRRARCKKYYENNKEIFEKHYERNKEKILANQKDRYENNKEYFKKWRDNNKEHIAAYNKEWREKNKEKRREYDKEYYENNHIHADREGNNFCVYIHTDPAGKVYVGISFGEDVKTVNRERWNSGNGYRGQRFYDECIAVYGWDNIQHEIIEWGLTYEEVIEREQYWIERYNSRNPEYGYNVA